MRLLADYSFLLEGTDYLQYPTKHCCKNNTEGKRAFAPIVPCSQSESEHWSEFVQIEKALSFLQS